jgi:hypothetical protein
LFTGPDSGAEEFFLAAYRHFAINYPKFHKMDNLSKLGFLSAELLLKDRNLGLQYSGDEVGIILMNASSSLDTDKSYQETINYRDNYFPSPSVFVYTLPNIVIGEICIKHKFFGEGSFFVLKEFDTFFLVDYVLSILDNDVLKCCIAGWVEINQDDFKSVVYLIEDTIKSDVKFAKFEPTAVQNIFEKKH